MHTWVGLLLFMITSALACTNKEKQCTSDNKCLPAIWWCDGQEDCADGSDESACDPCNSHPCKNNGTCYGTKFGFRCVCVENFAGMVCEKPICDHQNPTQRSAKTEIPGGATYARWGRTSCPGEAQLVYKGYAGGSHWKHPGGGSNYICLPAEPTWSKYSNNAAGYLSYVYGAEYELLRPQSTLLSTTNSGGAGLHNNDVPCVVCKSKYRTSVLMVPGKKECFNGWVEEYTGMLMSAYYNHIGRTEFVCMDADPEIRVGGQASADGVLFYFVQAKCGSLPCPPYAEKRELACVVCTM